MQSRCVKEGLLHKIVKKKWKEKWCRVQKNSATFLYFNKRDEARPEGVIAIVGDGAEISEIGEYEDKKHCFRIGTKAGKKAHYFAASNAMMLEEWLLALKQLQAVETARLVKFATAEVFLTQGIRVSGDVNYSILESLSHKDCKKVIDGIGWYCNATVSLAFVLNVFTTYGWRPETVYRSSAISPIGEAVHPVIRVIFCRAGPSPAHASTAEPPDCSRKIKSSSASELQINVLPSSCTKMHKETDEELLSLMKDFDIPLTLLYN